ncbi:MAG TPA: preprotein translocase subunit YajC [Planctomycetes bacterium]|nr:preprotein translocase subunit YajC [Planctomycetota bacterium]
MGLSVGWRVLRRHINGAQVMAKLLIVLSLLWAQADDAQQPAVAPAAEAAEAANDGAAGGQDGGEGQETEAKDKQAAEGKNKEQPAKKGVGIGGMLMPMVLIFGLFYMMFILPDRKKRANLKQQLDELSTNDRVVTIGGILGTVARVNKDAEEVTLILDESNNTRMKIVRSAIRQILRDEDPGK